MPYAWAGSLLFCRIGSVLMLAPGWGESSVPAQFRLSAALLATMALVPNLIDQMPPVPELVSQSALLIISEILIGIMMGAGARILMSALQVGGQIIGISSGLAMATQFDPTIGSSSAIIGVFMSMTAIVLIMIAGIHRDMLQAAVDSYQLFKPGEPLPIGDAAQWELGAMSSAFKLGLQIAAPILVVALVFNLSIGLVARLIPQVQVFFIAMPIQVMLGLSIMTFILGGGLLVWLDALGRYARLEGPF
ncbi:flagellar biosynthetic protein FliR [Hirschia baltica]|uniref:Flagellar biosynthetic protein FliR n=1 Tax=Hirschia baltica (strain ATCC 49814 / DSM 5838 / IFAM 1418) TaxID=582402 RepID=C6XLQ1_HIRBI|nr:flagellar biosynthetic protein FliR [Hirschia baltica]ACT57957.1 flagellar biosynthetic protein FliR [Hirschia baltica ATCC 49814]